MPTAFAPHKKLKKAISFNRFWQPAVRRLPKTPALNSRGHRPLQMDFEEQLKTLVYYHLQEHKSGRHLLQDLEENVFARREIAPAKGIKKSSYFEAINSRGLEQMLHMFEQLQADAAAILPKAHGDLGELVAVDGTIIDAVLSMHWADFKKGKKKAKAHIGFDLNRGIPFKIFLSGGMADERPYVSKILSPGQTGVMDRYYQRHNSFDQWQKDGIHFVCRLRDNTIKTVIRKNVLASGSKIFYDAVVFLGSQEQNLTQKEVRVVGYRAGGKKYWIATDRFDLSAEQLALIYGLRWNIEIFFGWWKKHLKVYHLIARTKYGLMVQMLAGLITYLLLAIYCHEQHNEKVSIRRVRQLRIAMHNELVALNNTAEYHDTVKISDNNLYFVYAKT